MLDMTLAAPLVLVAVAKRLGVGPREA